MVPVLPKWILPSVAGHTKRAPIAVNRLIYAAHELRDPLSYNTLASRYFLFSDVSLLWFHDVINWRSRVSATPVSDHRLLISKLETDARRKKEEDWRKKFVLVANIFCGHAYSTGLIGPFVHIRSTNQSWRKKKKTKLSVSNLLMRSLWPD